MTLYLPPVRQQDFQKDGEPFNNLFDEVQSNNPSSSNPFIQNVRHLHPAQLKILLLIDPQLAEEIELALDKASD